ncbi:MAG: ATP F0F1 synthase subunit I [Thalassobium sp.]|jgi:ATP synthase protein I|uniref:F0F1 ATP synthase subunit I n=1 Tax=Thalassolituus pacificus TaxID=2975440 RepID=A0A9X3ASM8_9GAMM|nr:MULTISPECIES: F0F1 ATP synthase subunit I [Thalassolituus]MBU2040208.1 F0F1 ATP synthase subunit I [Gammaproteobacteria bacterium]PHS65242.1 MAG: ATP F0F1 synthase subunit I [Thalassobium sp.]PIQ39113.1 MAG: ATP F0F1 synthase subunit I [Thalassolituus sp. CG17_big_fil_post_rev_8_21_14_2_50_53_8]MCA6058981.1 ATP synthase subunit I [Thalassolituus sp. ST750PaO-4]MCB2387131.1 F0F1 ATP synthase subunit I [Thalassolituus alkanivorans]|tara:strand:- start:591 stop:959 length:369 start_codon:yes stop_codon:yes gene_type:complete
MTGIPRPPAYRIVILQLILTVLAALVAWLHSDVAAKSALLGGLTCALPNAYFVWRAFRYSGARSSVQIVQSFYQGESWKFVLTALSFAVIFQRVEPLNVLALFAAFITVQLGHLAAAKIANL